MKRIIYSLLALSTLTGIASCNKFLDKLPTDFITPKNYFKNETDVMTALAGVYDVLGKTNTYGRTLYYENDISDEGFNAISTTSVDLSLNNHDASHTAVNGLWNTLYSGINRANMFLENIDNKDLAMDEAKRVAVKGEVLFLRAYYYFVLSNNYGAIPMRLESIKTVTDVNIARTPLNKLYPQILKDMEAAGDMVYPSANFAFNSRITKSTVWGILARVNLKMAGEPYNDNTPARFEEVKKWTLKVMDGANGHALNPDYAQIFINQCQDKYDRKEVIWEVEFNKLATGGQEEEGSLGSITGIASGDKAFGYSYGAVHVTERYYKAFEAKDLRRDWTINPYYYGTVGGVPNSKINYPATSIYNRCNAKWRREYETAVPKNVGTTPINFPLLRYSDILLMYAEAENEVNGATGDAYDAVNKVRRRGYGLMLPTPPNPTVNADLPTGMDKLAFRDAIRKERSLELGFEALRKFDLVRWGLYLTTMHDLGIEISTTAPTSYKFASRCAENTAPRHLLLPIPSTEIALNKSLVQNPEW